MNLIHVPSIEFNTHEPSVLWLNYLSMDVLAMSTNEDAIPGANALWVLSSAIEAVFVFWHFPNLAEPPLLLLKANGPVR